MRKLVFAIVILLCAIFLIAKMSEVESIIETIQHGDWRFIGLSIVLITLWMVNNAASYKIIFSGTGIQEKLGKTLLLAAASNFINIVAPTAGMSGMAIFISEARRRGYSTGRVTVAGVLFTWFDYAAFLLILSVGLIVLIRRENLNIAEIIATLILFLTATIIAYLLYVGTQSAEKLSAALCWLTRVANKILKPFIHRDYLSEQRADGFAHEASDGLKMLPHRPAYIVIPFLLALTGKILLMLILLLMFLAFEVTLTPGTLIAGFSLGYLFTIVSPTPAGIGFVEGGLTLALSTLYVPLGQAAVIALSYRGITFWLPLLFGGYAFRYLSNAKEPEPVS